MFSITLVIRLLTEFLPNYSFILKLVVLEENVYFLYIEVFLYIQGVYNILLFPLLSNHANLWKYFIWYIQAFVRNILQIKSAFQKMSSPKVYLRTLYWSQTIIDSKCDPFTHWFLKELHFYHNVAILRNRFQNTDERTLQNVMVMVSAWSGTRGLNQMIAWDCYFYCNKLISLKETSILSARLM